MIYLSDTTWVVLRLEKGGGKGGFGNESLSRAVGESGDGPVANVDLCNDGSGGWKWPLWWSGGGRKPVEGGP